MPRPPVTEVRVHRYAGPGGSSAADAVVVEEPLEIRVSGDTVAITMRTPGHDRELALGFLFAEGIVGALADVSAIAHCGRTGDEGRENTIEVTPAPGARVDVDRGAIEARRGTLTTSSCGICGRRTIEDLLARAAPLPPGPSVHPGAISAAARRLRGEQPTFERTGGCHGALLARFDGTVVRAFEDVGRHNAVDKVVGASLLAGELPLAGRVLLVSGRVSFEIVQKAIVAGIPVVAGVSAASSLAIETAACANLALCGFVRGDDLVVYAGGERVSSDAG